MRITIVTDIHSNLEALQAVLRHAEGQKALDALWCLGDVVGYGPDPNPCIQLLSSYSPICLMGNHDLAAIGQLDTTDFNADAAAAARWTSGQLGEDERRYLEALPQVIVEGDFTLVHGTLRWPVWEYLFSVESATAHLKRQQTPFGLVGHTHIPMLVKEVKDSEACDLSYLGDGAAVHLGDERLVINPGGTGQPRDGDPRASYAVYDKDGATLTIHRVEYDIGATQKKMAAAGLPQRLITRLSYGR